ncbi:MAG: S1C family serine protease, partial [Elainella sp.]
ERWQQANCQQYNSPLDVTCLDSVVSFGRQANQLLVNLPVDPEQAALEVVSRREDLRRRQLRPPMTPSKRLLLREGLERDRALADLIASGAIASVPPSVPPSVLPSVLPSVAPQPDSPALPSLPNSSAPSSAVELSADQIYQQLKPSTVEIWNVQNGVASTASGVILNPNGLVLTNQHVVQSNPRPSAKLADGRKFEGRVMSIDDSLDLALIQLSGASGLPTTPFASNTSSVQVGDQVYAIGSPRGESWKMSQTQVIELNSTCANGASPLRCIRTPSGFLHPGNSGGPLINAQGEVIGLNRAVQQSTGEGVSIPVETIQSFLAQRVGQSQPEAPRAPAPFRWLPRLSQPKSWL